MLSGTYSLCCFLSGKLSIDLERSLSSAEFNRIRLFESFDSLSRLIIYEFLSLALKFSMIGVGPAGILTHEGCIRKSIGLYCSAWCEPVDFTRVSARWLTAYEAG